MSTPIRIDVSTGSRPYAVLIGDGLTAQLQTLLDEANCGGRRVIVSNPLVWKLHGPAVSAVLPEAGLVLIPDGERFKHLQTVAKIYENLIKVAADRSAALVTFGGGIVGDVGGFAAATYLRGIGFAQVPTTLLAQVDAAIGGKVGVNHASGKNLIGAFYPPALVAIDPAFLATLPRREFRAGLYEVVKYGMACSPTLFDRLQKQLTPLFARQPGALIPIIEESCRIKARIVSEDEREAGPRRVLNFGHTAGHALEAATKYRRFRHGEAVAYGMLVAAEVAVRRGALAESDRSALGRLLAQLGPLPSVTDLAPRDALAVIRHDKKVVSGKLHFVLPIKVGATTIVDDVTEKELEHALRAVGLRG